MISAEATPNPETPVPPGARPRRPALRIALIVVGGLLLLAFIGIQLIPVNRANAAVTTPIKWDSPQTEALARRACMDCHSNETVWPWYSYVAPSSWLVYYDVTRGRSEWNLSTLGAQGENPFASQRSDLAFQLGTMLAGGRRFGGGPGGDRRTNGERRPPGGGLTGRLTEQIQDGSMPPANYTMMHPDAVLTSAERQQLLQGLLATLQGSTGASAQGN